MRSQMILPLALSLTALAVGPLACTSSSWCADCDRATAILGLHYQASSTYTAGTAIPVNPPNPSGGTPKTYDIASGSLPAGLSLDPATGHITGTPTTPGVFTLTLRGTNGANSVSQTIQITVLPAAALALSYATPQVFPAALAIAAQSPVLTQNTPGIPTTFAITSGALPAGLALNANGSITGTPTTAGIYPFTVTATNGTRTAAAAAAYTVTPAGSLGLSYDTPKTFTAGTAIATQQASLVNGVPGLASAYALSAGSLPAGLSLDAGSGDIAGTPSTPGVYAFTVGVTQGTRSTTASAAYTVQPAAALSLDYTTPQTFPVGAAIATQLPTLANATPGLPTTYAVSSGALPAGLALNANGSITGTPTTAGIYPFTVTATNGTRTAAAAAAYTVTPAGSLGLSYDTPKTFTAGTAIATQQASLVNGVPGLASAYALSAGSLPAGLSLDAGSGDIAGTPSTPGTYAFTVGVTQGARSTTASAAYTVQPAAALSLDYTTPQTFPVGAAIATQLPTLANATPGLPTTYAVSSGALPAGLALNANGSITGTPTTTGVSTFTVTATNGGRTAAATPTYTVVAGAPQAAYQSVTTNVNLPLTVTPQNAGGSSTAATLVNGPLPAGMTLNANGTITGTPTATGAFPFTVQLCNGTGCVTTATAVITVNANGVTPLKATYTDGNGLVGAPLSVAPSVTIGAPVTAATLQGGTLPAGMVLQPDGSITGTPSAAGSHPLLITLANAEGAMETVPVTLTVSASATALTATYAPATGQTGSPLVVAPLVTGGGPVASAVLQGGVLPPGLTLNPDGSITGTPTQAGSFPVQILLCNAQGGCTAQPARIDVNSVGTALNAAYADADGTLGTPLTVAPTLSSGGPVTAATLLNGSLPPGMVLNPNGSISGTPTQPGTYSLVIQLCDGAGACTVQSVTITLRDAAPVVSPLSVTETVGAVTTLTPSNTGGAITSATVTSGGPLAPGFTLNANGTISQAGTAPIGTYGPYTVNYCNTGGCSSSTVTITVNLTAPTALNYTTPVTYTTTVAISDNNPNPTGGTPSAYAVTAGTLPTGLSLNPSTGVISGTPTAATAGAVSVTIRGTNGAGGVNQTISITVIAYPTANLSSNPSTVPVDQSSSLTALFTGSADGKAVLTGDGIATPLSITSGTSVPTGAVSAAGTTRNYLLTVTNPQGYVATSTTSVQWVAVPSDTWTVTIPPGGGGPLTPGGGSLLNGQISLTVPDQGQSVCGDVVLTVNKEASLPGPIIASARDYSHTFNIASNLGYPFRVPISVTLAYDPALASPNLLSTELPMAFYWDPSYSKWVATGLKAIDTTAHTVTFTTLLPGRYAVLGIPGLAAATQTLGFASGTDDWRQNNPSVYDLPNGASAGMSSFASWYFPFMKPANGSVGLFNQFPTVGDANAAALISRLANGTTDSWNAIWRQSAYSLSAKQTGLALLTGLMVTGQPQVFLMSDARPAVNNGLATVVYGYDNATGKFKVMDPNYPGDALTIAWNSGTGAFSGYDRDAGYSPALSAFAFEGQTSIHRLADYDRVFSGAVSGFPGGTFAAIDVTSVGGTPNPDITQDVSVASASNVTISGTVANGDETATHIFWSQNGSAPRTAVPLSGNTFTFQIPALADPYATTVSLETTSTPCDPTFSHSGFAQFVVKQTGLSPWFPNSCFENGAADPAPWVLEQGSNSGRLYPTTGSPNYTANPTYDSATGEITNGSGAGQYNIAWSPLSPESALVYSPSHAADANVPAIATVLDGSYSFRVNNPATGARIARMHETITVPNTVANPKLTFYWAGAMQSAGHVPNQLPYVDILVYDLTSSEVLYSVHHYPPSTVSGTTYTDGYPGWVAGNGSGTSQWFGINWQKVSLNLGASRQNHQLKITVMAADCTQGGHGGYAYIDNIGCH